MENNNKLLDNKELEKKVEDYSDIEGLSTKKLNFGLWIIEHKALFKKLLFILLIAISAITWAYTIYGFAYYLAKGMEADQVLVQELISNKNISHDYLVNKSARNFSYSEVIVLKTETDKYDLVVKITNPNLNHWGNFEYCFYNLDQVVDCATSFIMPGEEKYILALAKELFDKSADISFLVNDLKWSRINLHNFPDWNKFSNEHLDINFSDINFNPASSSGLSEKLNLSSLEFKAKNNSPYNYWECIFNIIFYRGSTIVGINKYNLNEFMSGEEKLIEMSWPSHISSISDVKILPEINILADNIYIKYDGGVGEIK